MKLALIPARGGSKRIPRKNIRLFAGKPMIAYSIECARQSGLFDRVIVSTDDDDIAAVSRSYGAEVPFRRPASLADDYATTSAVVAHAIASLHDNGTPASAVCCIYATAPFIRSSDIAAGLRVFDKGRWNFVFSATTFAYPVFRSFRLTSTGGLEMFFPAHFPTRSQDLPEALHDAGQFYWGTPEAWLTGVPVFGPHSTVVRIPRWRVQDIDTEEDWIRAEMISKAVLQTDG